MRGAATLALAALIVSGCERQASAPPAATTRTSEPAPALAAPTLVATGTSEPAPAPPANAPLSLVGEWRVAGVDGAPIDAPIGIALSIDANSLGFDPRCAGFTWDYDYAAGQLTTKQRSPAAVCEIGYDPVLDRLATALSAVQSAKRTPANAIELTGGGHSVTLFSQ